MATTLIGLPFRRFVRQANTPTPQALVATERTLREAVELLKVAEWRPVRDGLAVTMHGCNPYATSGSDTYDAYKFSGAVTAESGTQSAFVGMAAYRFTLPTGATELIEGNPANVTAASLLAFANKFLSAGLLVSAYLSDSETPETDWETLRAGTWNTGAIMPDPDAGTKDAENKSATINVVTTAAAAKAYLWVIIQLYDWTEIKWEYWIEGAGMLDGTSISVTFDRDGVTKDPPSTEFYYPMRPIDIYEPSTVFPVDRLRKSGSIILKGSDISGNTYFSTMIAGIPDGLSGIADFSISGTHAVILKADGTVIASGSNTYGEATVPAGLKNVVAVYAAGHHSLALKADGTVVAWGGSTTGESIVPYGLTNVVAISGYVCASMALKSDGTVVGWGTGYTAGTVTGAKQISGKNLFGVILKIDGTVIAFGNNDYGQCNVPAGLTGVTKVVAGYATSLALKSDGTVVAWGSNIYGLMNIPVGLTNVVDLMFAGMYAAIAIKSDGTLVKWGTDTYSIAENLIAEKPDSVMKMVTGVYNEGGFLGTPTVWKQSSIKVLNPPYSGFSGHDINMQRESILRDAVANASSVTQTATSTGTIGIVETTHTGTGKKYLELFMASAGFSYSWRATNRLPNKVHFALPVLDDDAYGEIFCRVVLLKDNNATATDPTKVIASWKSLWNGEVPANYSILGAQYMRFSDFRNSNTIDIATPGYSGNFWMVIIPIHAPLAGTSTAWNITQTGFDATSVFMLRD